MAKKPVSIENRLILSLASHNGTATLTEIRLDFYGRLTCAALEQAIQKLGDLVTVEKTRSKRSRRPTTSLTLTQCGRVAAIELQPGWVPRRFSIDELKVELAERQAQRDPWAMSLLKDADDARQWRQHEHERKARDREREKKCAAREKPEARYPSAGRERSEEELQARRDWAQAKGFTPKYAEDLETDEELHVPAEPRQHIAPPPATPTPTSSSLRPGGFCERCHLNSELCQCSKPVPGRAFEPVIRTRTGAIPDDPVGDAVERIKKKAIRLGYGNAIKPNGILYDSRVIDFYDWDARIPD